MQRKLFSAQSFCCSEVPCCCSSSSAPLSVLLFLLLGPLVASRSSESLPRSWASTARRGAGQEEAPSGEELGPELTSPPRAPSAESRARLLARAVLSFGCCAQKQRQREREPSSACPSRSLLGVAQGSGPGRLKLLPQLYPAIGVLGTLEPSGLLS
ncbi:unnamed protein product, partial [Prorocentrum cordatum]